jgi:hypothetical protein
MKAKGSLLPISKLSFALLTACLYVSAFPLDALATVAGEGTISFTLPVAPAEAYYANGGGYYGRVGTYSTATDDIVDTFLNASYVGSDTYLNNHVEAVWGGTNPSSLKFTANAPGPNVDGSAEVDFRSYFIWVGTDFPGFSYHYSFYGTVDSSNDRMNLGVQMEIASDDRSHLYYSDYADSADEFRTKWPWFVPVGGVINASGDVTFAPIVIGDGNVSRVWEIGWDFVGNGFDRDYAGGPSPIPEPETYAMLLAGLGVLDFFARRRKQSGAAA